MQRVRDLLFDKNPYDGFDASAYEPDLQGWGSDHPLLLRAIELVRPTRIVEVGAWKGRSAINMAREIKRLGLNCELVCVDTWLGSPEHWLRHMAGWYESLAIQNGFPKLYFTFLANVVREGLTDIVTPFPSTSDNAAYIFEKLGIHFDIAYIDAAHEYEPALRDYTNYWSILREPGLLIGDDYNASWPGVVRAANDFAKSQSISLFVNDEKFAIGKGLQWLLAA